MCGKLFVVMHMVFRTPDMAPTRVWCPQVAATCKHFAAYSLEAAEGFTRQTFDAHVNARHALCPANTFPFTPEFSLCKPKKVNGSWT